VRVSRLGPDIVGSAADFSHTDSYAVARQQGRHVGTIYFHDGSEPYVTIHVGGTSDRQGSIVADVNLKLIWDIVAAIRIGETGRAFLIDSQGRLISHPDIASSCDVLMFHRCNMSGPRWKIHPRAMKSRSSLGTI
jgi:hypothetical protein